MSGNGIDPEALGRFAAMGGAELLQPKRNVIIQAKIKEVKNRATKDVSRFKIGNVYRLSANADEMLLISDIGPHPLDRLPCGYGTVLRVSEVDGKPVVSDEPGYLHLYLLDPKPAY